MEGFSINIIIRNNISNSFRTCDLIIYHNKVINMFCEYFKKREYIKENSVLINSRIDKSVCFIGSTISVFKKYFIENISNVNGYYITQRCLRSHNVSHIYDDSYLPDWSSYFMGLGTISSYDKLEMVSLDICNFIKSSLGISREDIRVRACSLDFDLLYTLQNIKDVPIIEVDTQPFEYYRHKYGVEGIIGRNVNFCIMNKQQNKFVEIGNLIVIERTTVNSPQDRLAIEFTFGVSTLIRNIFSKTNSIETSLISQVIPISSFQSTKFLDALASSIHLMHEGIKPNASNNRSRILREYIYGILYWIKKLNISQEKVILYAKAYEILEYGDCNTASMLNNYMENFMTRKVKNGK